jgi:hypothetical protein
MDTSYSKQSQYARKGIEAGDTIAFLAFPAFLALHDMRHTLRVTEVDKNDVLGAWILHCSPFTYMGADP